MMSDEEDAAALAGAVGAVLEEVPGRIDVSVRAAGGELLSVGATRIVPAASTIKVAIMVAALREVQAGRIALDEALTLPAPAERVGGAGALVFLPELSAVSLRSALSLTIAISDNDAANAVVGRIGRLAVSSVLADAGCADSVLARDFMDADARAAGRENLTTAADLTRLVAQLRAGQLLRADLTDLATGLLAEQLDREGMLGYLTPDLRAGSKPGMLPGVRAEVALIERGDRWVSVACTSTDLESDGIDWGTGVLPVFATIGALVATICLG